MMEPGKELDTLIALKVMGWRQVGAWEDDGEPIYADDRDNTRGSFDILPYSSDMTAAWKVVERLQSPEMARPWRRRDFAISREDRTCDGLWCVTTDTAAPHGTSPNGESVFAKAETAPLAICLAALKAVE